MKPKINRSGDEYKPKKYDACQTPSYALKPLLPYINQEWRIWEPAMGEGLLVDAFHKNGYDIICSDILTGTNFFEYSPESDWNCQITNPPYSIKYKWLKRSYELNKPFALLLPVETLGAKIAQKMFSEYGINIIFMDSRVNFKMPNIGFSGSGAQFPTAWFCWKLPIESQMVFKHLDKMDGMG